MADRLTTLEAMMKPFDAPKFMMLFGIFADIHKGRDNPFARILNIGDDDRKTYLLFCQSLNTECQRLHLPVSAGMTARMIEELQQNKITFTQFDNLCQQLSDRLIDEMRPMIFFCIDPNDHELLRTDSPFGNKVIEAFPSARDDIRAAARCLALDCWTAAVMHCMRVLEVGLAVLAANFKIASDRQNWNALIQDINKQIKKISKANFGQEWRAEKQFYSEAVIHVDLIKDAWRNHAMHANATYDEEDAQAIYQHTKEFMRRLATRLKEGIA